MLRKVIGIYCFIIGCYIVFKWFNILSTGQVHQGAIEISFRLLSEFTMGILAITAGILLFRKNKNGAPFAFCSLGMVLYWVANAAGYYGQQGDSVHLFVFVSLFVFTIVALVALVLRPET